MAPSATTPIYGAHAIMHAMDFTLQVPKEAQTESLYPNTEATRLKQVLATAAALPKEARLVNEAVDTFETAIFELDEPTRELAVQQRKRMAAVCAGELEPTPKEVVNIVTIGVLKSVFTTERWCGISKHQLRLILPVMAHWSQIPRKSPYFVLVKRKLAVLIGKLNANGYNIYRYQEPIEAMPDVPSPSPVVAGVVGRDATTNKAERKKGKAQTRQAWLEGEFSSLGKRKFHEYAPEPEELSTEDSDPGAEGASSRKKARMVGRPILMSILPRLLLPAVEFTDRHRQFITEDYLAYRKDIIPTFASHMVDVDRHTADTAAQYNEKLLLRHMRTILYIDNCERTGVAVSEARRATLPLPKRFYEKEADGSFKLDAEGQKILLPPPADPYDVEYDVEGLRMVVPIFTVDTQYTVLRMVMEVLKDLKDSLDLGAEAANVAGYADSPSQADLTEIATMFTALSAERLPE